MSISLPRAEDTANRIGCKGVSGLYARIADGLCTPGVKLGPRCVGWPDYEIDAIVRARIAGKTDDQVRELVKRLLEERKSADALEAA